MYIQERCARSPHSVDGGVAFHKPDLTEAIDSKSTRCVLLFHSKMGGLIQIDN